MRIGQIPFGVAGSSVRVETSLGGKRGTDGKLCRWKTSLDCGGISFCLWLLPQERHCFGSTRASGEQKTPLSRSVVVHTNGAFLKWVVFPFRMHVGIDSCKTTKYIYIVSLSFVFLSLSTSVKFSRTFLWWFIIVAIIIRVENWQEVNEGDAGDIYRKSATHCPTRDGWLRAFDNSVLKRKISENKESLRSVLDSILTTVRQYIVRYLLKTFSIFYTCDFYDGLTLFDNFWRNLCPVVFAYFLLKDLKRFFFVYVLGN